MQDEKVKNYQEDPNPEHGKDNQGHHGNQENHGGQVVKPAPSHSLPYVPCVRNY